ncbi:MATE family efflux transporter [Sungkyunkwania multivorans]|uniref:Multidrug-efflux transporter n=1 Tax=Sungkyunkwania multivorans TaxID=1173618 RepID=A0ABW3CZM0_9FLAO
MKTSISFRHINKLAVPAIVAGIAEPILSATDTAVVGNIPINGTESLAAVGIVGTFLSMLIWILAQTRSAISAIISQHLGAGRIAEVKTLPAQAIAFNIGLSLLVLVSTIPFIPQIFMLLKAEGIVLDYCISYYSIRVWGFPLTLFTFAIFGIFRGLQNTFWPMVISLVGVVVNIILDFALVYGIEGLFAGMNLEGAAWASLIAQAVMAVMSFILLLKKTEVSLKIHTTWHPEMNRLIIMTLNLFVRSVALNFALILAVREATALGTDVIAAHTIGIQIWLFTAFFIDGYGAAGNILGGKLLGARDFIALNRLTKRITIYGLVVSLFLGILGLLGYNFLGTIFSSDEKVLTIFASFFYIVLFTLPFSAIAFVLDGLFKGLGEMGYLRNVLLASTFLGFLPVLLMGKYLNWGIQGVWTALVVWIAFRGAALVVKFKKKYAAAY